jgi:hypothetical protein
LNLNHDLLDRAGLRMQRKRQDAQRSERRERDGTRKPASA